MASDTFSGILGYLQMATGNDLNTWGVLANANVFQIFENATFGMLSETVTGGTLDLSTNPPPAAANQVGYGILNFSGGLTSKQIVKIPNLVGKWIVFNNTTGAFALQLETATGSTTGTPLTIPQGGTGVQVWCDGNQNLRIVTSGALLSILQFGGTGDGATDNTSALNSAFTALGSTGGAIYFPAGKYAFAGAVTLTLPSTGTPYDLTLFGDGADASILFWQAGGGLDIVYNSNGVASPNNQGSHTRDLAFSTGAAGAGVALTLSQANSNNGTFAAQSEVTRCAFRGDSPYTTQAWGTDLVVTGVSNVNVNGCAFAGPTAGGGNGLIFQGLNAGNQSVGLNVVDCVFNLKNTGLTIGSFAIAVAVTNCQYTNNIAGINAAGSNLAQLSVSNCQFTLKSSSNGIVTQSAVNAVMVTNCIFTSGVGVTTTSGILLSPSSNFTISNNLFSAASAAGNSGITVNNLAGGAVGVIANNIFGGLGVGIVLGSGTTGINLGLNSFSGCTANYSNSVAANLGNWRVDTVAGNFSAQIVNGGGIAGCNGLSIAAGASGASDSTTSMIQFSNSLQTATVGSITRSGTGVAYNITSDERLKLILGPTDRGLATLLNIPVEDFIWRDDPDGKAVQGLVAQHLFPYYPEAVMRGGEDPKKNPWAIDHGRLTPLLIRSVQEIADRLAALEAKPPRRATRKQKPRKAA